MVLSERARALACDVKSYGLGSRVTVWWNGRLQTTAGTADSVKYRIDLNPKLARLGHEVVDRILRHELAHLVAVDRNRHYRIQPHGDEWKLACSDLGIPGEKASHSLPIDDERQRAKYAYRCPNCSLVVERKRKMRSNLACYECCNKFNGGDFHSDFVFERTSVARRSPIA